MEAATRPELYSQWSEVMNNAMMMERPAMGMSGMTTPTMGGTPMSGPAG